MKQQQKHKMDVWRGGGGVGGGGVGGRGVDVSGDVTTDHGQSNGNADSTVLELGSNPLCLTSGISVTRQGRFRHVVPELPDGAGSARGHSGGARRQSGPMFHLFPSLAKHRSIICHLLQAC